MCVTPISLKNTIFDEQKSTKEINSLCQLLLIHFRIYFRLLSTYNTLFHLCLFMKWNQITIFHVFHLQLLPSFEQLDQFIQNALASSASFIT
mmetsp:Transcript_57853/g.69596  ORF Transcript_57853/g.69596 Transcript_57853/m.69596 type:complete len:92 (+) Transcript_57853:460-735(+)